MKLTDLANNGVLRAAINTGNRALVQLEAGVLTGVSPALAERLAHEIGAKLETVIYDGAGKVFADSDQDKWDVGFLAIDDKRAEKIVFTRPYITIEATFAVRANSNIGDVEDIDKAGVTVLTALGSAYDMHLTKTLEQAELERFGTPPESFAAFQSGRCDAVAGVRESLMGFFGEDEDVRILSGILTSVHQAMVLPNPRHPLADLLDDFVGRAIKDGFVAKQLG
jgi:polar amino acid transport system substrate-binding protein